MLYVIDQAFLAVTQLLSGNKHGKYVTFVNLRSDFRDPDVGAMFLNFLLALESRLRARSLVIPGMITVRSIIWASGSGACAGSLLMNRAISFLGNWLD